jgi:hypothetical protein
MSSLKLSTISRYSGKTFNSMNASIIVSILSSIKFKLLKVYKDFHKIQNIFRTKSRKHQMIQGIKEQLKDELRIKKTYNLRPELHDLVSDYCIYGMLFFNYRPLFFFPKNYLQTKKCIHCLYLSVNNKDLSPLSSNLRKA